MAKRTEEGLKNSVLLNGVEAGAGKKKQTQRDTHTQHTFLIEKELYQTFEDYAYTERLTKAELINMMFREYLDEHAKGKKLLHKPNREN